MPFFERDDVKIHYTDSGSGYPVMLFAPGLMRSSIGIWERQDLNAIKVLDGHFRVIAMDQRNAGESTAPVRSTDSWADFAQDAIGLIDHLGLKSLHIWGRCIGPSFCMKVLEELGDRAGMVSAFVDHAPIGLDPINRGHYMHGFYEWAEELPAGTVPLPIGVDPTIASFCENMFGNNNFVFSVSYGFIQSLKTPTIILPGRDLAHPEEIALRTASLMPHAELRMGWQNDLPAAAQAVLDFLRAHTPA